MHSFDWNDLQFVLAVAEGGSLAAAARRLGVNHTTVLRRVAAFEERLGVKLFERLPTGYALTGAGEELARAARQVGDTVTGVERQLAGRDLRLTGTVRIATTDTLAHSIVPTALHGFTRRHDGMQIELTTSTALVSLSKRDADVAVRPSSKPAKHLFGRKLCDVALALYASASYLERKATKLELSRHEWLMPDDSLATTSVARWMQRELRGVVPVLRADTFTTLAQAAVAGLGLVALPCYLGDRLPGLVRVRGVVAAMSTELWILTHDDLRHTARIRAVMDWFAKELGGQRALFEGRSPPRLR